MEPLRIKSLKQLKEWNRNPTKELPIVYDWFMSWFFRDVLMKNKIELAKDAHETHINFCMICENFTRDQAIERVNKNIGYYSGYSSEWGSKLNKHFPEISHPVFGKVYM